MVAFPLHRPTAWARVVVLCLGPPGLVVLLARAAPAWPTAASVAVQFAAFVAAATTLARTIAPRGVPGERCVPSHEGVSTAWFAAALAGIVGGIVMLPGRWSPTGLMLFGAAAEEFVFRRELPCALARLLRSNTPDRAAALGVLLAQLVFAACHVATPGPTGALRRGRTFAELAVAGTGLAVLYRASGTLLVPVGVHFAVNRRRYPGTARSGD